MGAFGPRNPLSQEMGIRAPVWGRGNPKSKSPSVSSPRLFNKAQNKGMQGVRARYDTELPPFISVVRHPGRPVKSCWAWSMEFLGVTDVHAVGN